MRIEFNHHGTKIIVELMWNVVDELILKKVEFKMNESLTEYMENLLSDIHEDLIGMPFQKDVIERIVAKSLVERRILPEVTMFRSDANPIRTYMDVEHPGVYHVRVSIDVGMLKWTPYLSGERVAARKFFTISHEEMFEKCPGFEYLGRYIYKNW